MSIYRHSTESNTGNNVLFRNKIQNVLILAVAGAMLAGCDQALMGDTAMVISCREVRQGQPSTGWVFALDTESDIATAALFLGNTPTEQSERKVVWSDDSVTITFDLDDGEEKAVIDRHTLIAAWSFESGRYPEYQQCHLQSRGKQF